MAEMNEKALCTIEVDPQKVKITRVDETALCTTEEEGIAYRMDGRRREFLEFYFIVPGKPQGKARPRYTKAGAAYTPPGTRNYEKLIKSCYIYAGGVMLFPKGSPIDLEVRAFFPFPAALAKWKRAAILGGNYIAYAPQKPDGDNILKVVADALNGVAFYDDAQITRWSVMKAYDARPRLEIRLAGLVNARDELRVMRLEGGKTK